MRTKIGIRELPDALPATIRRVRSGETIEVTHHGATVAMLSPAPADRVQRLAPPGDIVPGEPRTGEAKRFPVVGELSASAALEEDRAAR